jgi:hypothetical protein
MVFNGCNFSLVFEFQHLLRGIYKLQMSSMRKSQSGWPPLHPFSTSEMDNVQGDK